MAKIKSRKNNVISVDFTGVEVGGVTVPEDKYEVEVVKVTKEESEAGNDYLKWEFTITEGKYKGKKLWHNTSLQQQSLWALRGVLESLGIEIPDETMDLDLSDLEGRTIGVEVYHDKFKGKAQAKIADLFEVTGEETEESEEEEEKPKKKAKKEEDEEESDEEEKPKKSEKKKGKKETRTYTSDAILEKNEDELQEVVDEHELDVDLSDYDKLRRKRSAVIDALEANGLMEDEAA